MEFLTGVLFAVCFFGVGISAYMFGKKSKQPIVPLVVDEESQRKAERVRQGFEQMMTYDVHTALKGKRVT